MTLEATLRVEDARPHRVLRARLPFVGHHSAKLRRSPFREYCRARGTSRVALSRDVPTSEADHRQPSERAGFALDDHLRIGKGPCGSLVLVRVIVTDTKSPVTLDGVDLQAHRGYQTEGVGAVRAGRRDAGERGWDARPRGACELTGYRIHTTVCIFCQ